MAKLQLYVTKSVRGYKNILNVNPEEEIGAHVHDPRHALETLKYDIAASHVIYMMTYLEDGFFITVLRTIADSQPGDNYAANVYVPYKLQISTEGLLEVMRKLASTLPSSNVDLTASQVSYLRDLFSQDYHNAAEETPEYLPSSGHLYPFVYFGGTYPALYDYIEARFYSPEFAEYAGILLLPANQSIEGRDRALDFTRAEIRRNIVLTPPRITAEGFVPHIYNHAFRRPMYVPDGTELEILWKRAGFDTVRQSVLAADGLSVKSPDTSLAEKLISPASFYITEQGTQRSIGSFMIKVNGEEIDHPHSFTYAQLADAKVEISSPGYFAFSGNLDLASTAQALVQMRQLHRTYRFDLPLHTPDPTEAIRIYLKTKKPITECPIEGYTVAGGDIIEGAGVSNNLIYVGGHRKGALSSAVIIGLALFVLGFIVGWLAFDLMDSSDNAAPLVETAVAEEVPMPDVAELEKPVLADTVVPDVIAADPLEGIAYLDANKVWNRADMEQIASLQGLYDDLNAYDYDRLHQYWAPMLEKSKNFAAVMRAVDGSVSAGKRDPRTDPHNPKYNNEADQSIHWLSYTYWVDP